MDIPSSRYICCVLIVIDVHYLFKIIKLPHLLNFLKTVVNIRKWRVHSNSALWEWSEVWTTFWLFSRQGEPGVRWPPSSHSLDVFIQCWKGWRNHLSKFRGMAAVLKILSAFILQKMETNYIHTFQFLLLCLLQFKESQEKDDSWSDCARKGYAGR